MDMLTCVDISKRLTSNKNPYNIIDIAYFVKSDNGNEKGRLSISICPGKRDKRYNRNLDADLQIIKSSGVQIIVCLLEWSEMEKLDILDYPLKAQNLGLIYYHLPIRDRDVPRYKELESLIPIVVGHLSDNKKVLIHCRSGLGRAGTISACCLLHFNYDGNSAIETVRRNRPGAIQTQQQEQCILKYYDKLIH